MSNIKELVRTYSFAIYPVLFGLFPLLSFYGANAAEIAVGSFKVSTFLFFNLIVAGVAWAVAALFTRNQHKSGILASVIILLFFTFGRVHNALPEIAIKTPVMVFGPTKILLAACVLIIVGTWFGLRKLSNKQAEKVSGTLLLVSAVLVATSLVTVFTGASSGGSNASSSSVRTAAEQPLNANTSAQRARPDIYYILLDGYTREDMLKANFGFDNSPFINALEKRGFYVADKANSNYAHTHFSVPSTFNMKYLNYLVDQVGERSTDRTPLRDLVMHHEVAKTFKSLGYKYVQIGSQWGWTATPGPEANLKIQSKAEAEAKLLNIPLDEFALVYLQTTALKPWIATGLRENLVAKTQGAFDRTKQVPEHKEPTVTFTHVVSPHPPYLFDRNGVIPDQTPLELDNHGFSDREKFTDQTTYVNRRVTEMIDKILANSEKPPIIILASDHGSAAGLTVGDFSDIDPNNLKEDGVKERQGILNAYYFPDKNYEKLYPHITPVNTFRLVFSQYFNKDYPLLPDRSYFSGNKDNNEYKLYDVTQLVNSDIQADTKKD